MTRNVPVIVLLAVALLMGAPAQSQDIAAPSRYADLERLPFPVVESDITDRPYRVIGQVLVLVRRATIFSKEVSKELMVKELWERGQKTGADAVIKAEFQVKSGSGLNATMAREARGYAVKFLTDAEIFERAAVQKR